MAGDPPEVPGVRARVRACSRVGCGRLHTNAQYCSRRCTAIVTRARQTPERRSEIAGIGRMKQFRGEVYRMIQRVKYYGKTVDEQIVLAWRYGKGAAKSERYRGRKASAA
jgi:hypothetical protein